MFNTRDIRVYNGKAKDILEELYFIKSTLNYVLGTHYYNKTSFHVGLQLCDYLTISRLRLSDYN